jgi:hypothetical protein
MSAYSSRWDEALILLDSTSFKVATNNKAKEAHAVSQHARELAVAPTEAYCKLQGVATFSIHFELLSTIPI